MKWNKRPVPSQKVRRLHEQFGLDLLTASIMVRRGIEDREQVKFYLENGLSFLHNPFLFEDMETAVDRIWEAVEGKELIRVFGDRDVDGITSTTLLVSELQRFGGRVDYRLPEGDEPYGLTLEGLDEAHRDGVTLIITVDCGISSFQETAKARELGIDTLVFDHHLSDDQLPPAMAIVDPKVEGCGYPFEHLAACGVVAKVIWALRFAKTDFYHEPYILLHAQPGKSDTIVISAVKMENFMEEDRLFEEINPGVMDLSTSQSAKFLSGGLPILVIDAQIERNQLRAAFGKSVDINLVDMRPQMEQALPMIKGKSLFTLSTMSRGSRYSEDENGELSTLVGLFNAFVMKRYPELDSGYDSILDLVAIGTVADLMPMVDENRILVRRGLKVIESGSRPSLQPLLSMQKLAGRPLTSLDISWYLTPVINSAGRMGKPEIALQMLLSKDIPTAQGYATQLLELNKQRQKLGEDSWSRILPIAKESFERSGSKIVLVEDEQVSRGMTGLMASRLLKQFDVPSLVLASVGDDRISGSIRSPQNFNCRDFLSRFGDLFQDFGGHACAGGFSMERGNLEELKRRIVDVVDSMEIGDSEEESIDIDCSLPASYLTPDLIRKVEFFEPYGEQNSQVVFAIEGARISDLKIMNSHSGTAQHVKFTLEYGSYKWPALYWNAAGKVNSEFALGDVVDVAFRMSRNYFRQESSLQLIVIDCKRSS